MINHSINKNLNLPIKLFFNTVRRVRNYKHFVPWCVESWESKGEIHFMKFSQLMEKFPTLNENKIAREKLKNIAEETDEIRVKQYEGGITVGFNILDFSYSCQIISIEPSLVLSITEGHNSHIFKKLESVWVMHEDEDKKSNEKSVNQLCVNYFINFEFKSFMFSHVTNLFLTFLGENIMKAFVSKCEKEMKENKEYFDAMSEDLNFMEILDHKLNQVEFDSVNEKEKIKSLLINLHIANKLSIKELNDLLKNLHTNQSLAKKITFLSENAVWSNSLQIEKIKREITSF